MWLFLTLYKFTTRSRDTAQPIGHGRFPVAAPYAMRHGKSNSHVTDDVTWPWRSSLRPRYVLGLISRKQIITAIIIRLQRRVYIVGSTQMNYDADIYRQRGK